MRIAIVSTFIDKRHRTECCVVEQIEHLVKNFGYEVHLYSQRVEDIEVNDGKERFIWHKIPDIPGPHLLKYLW